jgi:hypothetical protein
LKDVSTVSWIAAKFPQTTFHNARDVLSLFFEVNTVEKYGLYHVSPEVKKALLQWFYDNQDPQTGLWGPKSKSGKLLKKDVMNSVSIMKVFIDENGENRYAAFPLRYKNELSKTILEELSEPIPNDDELDEWHEWNLKTSKSIKALLSYLWDGISKENKAKTRNFIESYLTLTFEKFYIPKEGAFCYYPNGEHATIDGTGEISLFEKIGALSMEKQEHLWGAPERNITDLGIKKISGFKNSDFDPIANITRVNSIRLYETDPDYRDLTSGVFMVIYPKKPTVLDIMDLAPKVKHWLGTTDLTMGNWTSKEEITRGLEPFKLNEIAVYGNNIPIESLQETLKDSGKLVAIGFDRLQVPRSKIVYELKK